MVVSEMKVGDVSFYIKGVDYHGTDAEGIMLDLSYNQGELDGPLELC